MAHSHRPTTKHKHKSFKSGHASSRTLKDAAKGRLAADHRPASSAQRHHTKADRRNLARQIQHNKQQQLKRQHNVFGDGRGKLARLCGIVCASPDADPVAFVRAVRAHIDPELDAMAEDSFDVHVPNFRQRLQFGLPASSALRDQLDLVNACDFLIVLANAQDLLVDSPLAVRRLRALQAQGAPTPVLVLQDVPSKDARKVWEADVGRFFPNVTCYEATEVATLVRTLCTTLPDCPNWRAERGYVVVEGRSIEHGNMVVEGTVRGTELDVRRRIYIDGCGDFAISHITSADGEVLATNDADEEIEDAVEEDAWMEEELTTTERDRRGVRLDDHYYVSEDEEEVPVQRRLPKGTSAYQAAWITADTEAADDEEESGLEDEELEDAESVADGATSYAPTETDGMEHVELSAEENERQLAEYRARITEDQQFPDEVDYDPRIPARERFAKYRGLKDFHSSRWDADELEPNTPAWWRSILRFEHYGSTRNRLLKERAETPVAVGRRVRIHLRAVPESALALPCLAIWQLNPLEHKRAVVNLSIQLEPDVEPIASKEELVVQVGNRRFLANPIYSQHVASTRNNLVRYERFCQSGRRSMATFAGPCIVDRSGLPVLYFRRTDDGALRLVATGSFVNCNHARLTIKRSLLTGEPFKVHKRVVTVRFMFHSREDVLFFKPLRLRSKDGRSGFIREPLGTHGYMKTTWDGPLKGQDTITMPLYKRVYPRPATYA